MYAYYPATKLPLAIINCTSEENFKMRLHCIAFDGLE
jgi:hypothetical protein